MSHAMHASLPAVVEQKVGNLPAKGIRSCLLEDVLPVSRALRARARDDADAMITVSRRRGRAVHPSINKLTAVPEH